jgi:subtilase family serine protease
MKIRSRRIVSLRWAIVALVAIILVTPAFFLRYSPAHAASFDNRTTLSGHMIPALKNFSPLHTANSSSQLQLSISLNLRNQSQLTALLQAQQDPRSPLYHHYLRPQQFAALFGPTQTTVNQVTTWLYSEGLQVGSVASNHLLINASGSIATIQRAFSVNIDDYALNGRTVYAPTSEPSVPTDLASVIHGVSGLDNVAHYHPLNRLIPADGPGGGYTPTQLRTAYNMKSLISSADGTGQTIAIFELDGYKASDVKAYLSNYSLGSAKYSNVLVDGATNSAGSGAIEVELDMEVVSAIAPGATQEIYIGPNTNSGVNDTYNQIVADDIAPVTSISWGECEADSGTSELSTLDTIFKQGAAQGQSFFSAAGDAGAYDCGTSRLGVDSPADDPYVVGVGGTSLQVTSSNSYSSETVWSDPTDTSNPQGIGGGGGYSTYFSKPSYQTGTGVSSNTKRHVPDVSADADPNTGYSVYCSVTAAGCSTGSAAWTEIGGTSAAAPLWAAVVTDTNAYLAGLGISTLGNVNAELYSLFNTSQTYTAYHDITSGNNLYYSAGTGYDVASGIGTPNVWNFARDVAGV